MSAAGSAAAARWRIEITNVTPGQTLTPILVAVHHGESGAVPLGSPESEGLSTLAEGGDPSLLAAEIVARRPGTATQVIDGLLESGATAALTVDGRPGQRLTLAAMLIPTSDTFFAVDSVFLPLIGEARSARSPTMRARRRTTRTARISRDRAAAGKAYHRWPLPVTRASCT